jgi:hypothetical protein
VSADKKKNFENTTRPFTFFERNGSRKEALCCRVAEKNKLDCEARQLIFWSNA